jgi:phosphatidylserine/phosphatidylglycerophosphate/cardiolipin synthase-like enzyme
LRHSARDVRKIPEELSRKVAVFLDDYFRTLPAEDRAAMITYLTIGSCNMDYRSQVMNGEVMVALSSVRGLAGVIDFVLLGGQCEWPETPEQVDELLPPPGWFWRKLSAFVKVAI